MSTLSYTTNSLAPAETHTDQPERKGLWRRVFDAIVTSQERRAEHEIARYLANHGGLLTDDMERQINHRLAGGGRRPLS